MYFLLIDVNLITLSKGYPMKAARFCLTCNSIWQNKLSNGSYKQRFLVIFSEKAIFVALRGSFCKTYSFLKTFFPKYMFLWWFVVNFKSYSSFWYFKNCLYNIESTSISSRFWKKKENKESDSNSRSLEN